jgi:hypothetical protein
LTNRLFSAVLNSKNRGGWEDGEGQSAEREEEEGSGEAAAEGKEGDLSVSFFLSLEGLGKSSPLYNIYIKVKLPYENVALGLIITIMLTIFPGLCKHIVYSFIKGPKFYQNF